MPVKLPLTRRFLLALSLLDQSPLFLADSRHELSLCHMTSPVWPSVQDDIGNCCNMNISPDRGADTKTVPLVQTFLPRCWPGPGRQIAIEPSRKARKSIRCGFKPACFFMEDFYRHIYDRNDVKMPRVIVQSEESQVACQVPCTYPTDPCGEHRLLKNTRKTATGPRQTCREESFGQPILDALSSRVQCWAP